MYKVLILGFIVYVLKCTQTYYNVRKIQLLADCTLIKIEISILKYIIKMLSIFLILRSSYYIYIFYLIYLILTKNKCGDQGISKLDYNIIYDYTETG